MDIRVKFIGILGTIMAFGDMKTMSDSSIVDMYEFLSDKMNFTTAELECKNRGFHGLAIISSPEQFNFGLRLSEYARNRLGVWLALSYDAHLNTILWQDGTKVASDMPWLPNQPVLDSDRPCGRIHLSGYLGMIACGYLRFALCGYHDKRFLEGAGSTSFSAIPTNIKNVLSKNQAVSYLHCVMRCSRHNECRSAWFASKTSECTLIGPGGFDTLPGDDTSNMLFVRTGYSRL